MNTTVRLAFFIVAIILFFLSSFGVNAGRVNLQSLGLAFLSIALMPSFG